MLKFIPTPIGNPQDITIRALREFEKATLFLCEDTRETKRLLSILAERFEFIIPNAQFLSFHEHNGKSRLTEITGRLNSENIVFVSDAGMPIISDPGQILVEYCQQNGIEYDILPGASAVVTAYAASGFEEGKFTFWGFLPHKGSERNSELNKIMNSHTNMILYEAPHRIDKLIVEIAGIDENRELFFAKELTKKFQNYYKGTAQEILTQFENINSKGEWVVVIGAKKSEQQALYIEDILAFDMPPKIKSKLLSKITDQSVKEWYQKLISK
jgi:16S rRNA (cytidine1402-2'-O)-methyltransferase